MLSQIERGSTDPSLATIRKLAAVFGADLATLFAESTPQAVHHSKPEMRPGLAAVGGYIAL
ncbi:helix-turn-helix domain-containing protein [Pseudarthrobacter sp. Y6]|uniref:helix-turn-helix domain-containing protein n=1 Tax=Pseudarthrobacter sp. Y6 TaxID=3418422 RepID=UPI003CECA93C